MSSKIPEARKILVDVLNNCNIDNQARTMIEDCLPLMVRDSYKRHRASATSRRMTAELRDEILEECRKNPNAQTKVIANKFGVNQGRVSECLSGLYDHLD